MMIYCAYKACRPLTLLLALSIALPYLCGARVFEECVYLVPAPKADRKVLEKLKEKIPSAFPMSVKAVVETQKGTSHGDHDPARNGYDAGKFLDGLSEEIALTLINERALVITESDLYLPDKDSIFGLADPKRGICIISLSRLSADLDSTKPDYRLIAERALKEGSYELGRSWNIPDCPSPKCMMYRSGNLKDVDNKRDTFCYKCRIALENRHGSRGLFGAKNR